MGQEINGSHFNKTDFQNYRYRLEKELALLKTWFEEERANQQNSIIHEDNQCALKAGFEMEACLVDKNADPAGVNDIFIQKAADDALTVELARFNVEINSRVHRLYGNMFTGFQQELDKVWQHCNDVAQDMGYAVVMAGILPSLRLEHLGLDNMSAMTRYKALNEQLLRSRKGKVFELDIQGEETLKISHSNVMLESVATSFQLHLQIPFTRAVRFYNASIILSAPVISLCGNSPYLFGKGLWCETRIPVFEQAVASGGYHGAAFGPIKRVSFGSGYARQSLLEVFRENLEHYPILLPVIQEDKPEEALSHLLLHNGTVWRWNRPLVGRNDNGGYHFRLEHRVLPAGPTSVDCIANAAFVYGSLVGLSHQYEVPEEHIDFASAKENFYRAARYGLKAKLHWNGESISVARLLRESLLPLARDGLSQAGISRSDIDFYLGIVEQRLENGQTGAVWQRRFVEKYGRDMNLLTKAYMERQAAADPVHTWTI